MNPEDVQFHLRIEAGFRVDRDKGTLHDLAILTAGREASGHGIYIDNKTNSTALATVAASGGQLRAAIRHASILERLSGKGDRVLDMPGYFSDIRVDGNKLVAGKFEFFDAFKAKNPDAVAILLEMAEKTPKLFGLSAEPAGRLVFVDTSGNDHPAKRNLNTGKWEGAPAGVTLANGGLPTLRVTHLGVAAFVDQPAANDGLFAKLSSLFGTKPDVSGLKALAEAFFQFAESGALHTSDNNKQAPALSATKPTATPPTVPPPHMNIIEQITAKFSADNAKLSRVLVLHAKNPALSFEALEGQLIAADLADAQAQIATLQAAATKATTDLAAKDATIKSITTERDDFKAKFEAIKKSGYGAALNLQAAPEKSPDGQVVIKNLSAREAWSKPDAVIMRN